MNARPTNRSGNATFPASRPPSRRIFLKKGVSIAVGLSVPCFVPCGVLAGPGRPGANDRVHIGVIACGARAEYLIKNMPPAGRVVAICDCDTPKMDGLLRRSGGPEWATYQDFRNMIDRQKMDAVIVATVDHARVLASILACQAGMDVYAEKPLTLTIGEGQALIRAVRKYKRILQVGTQQRSMEPNHWAVEKIRRGAIGKVKTVLARQYKSPFFYKSLPREPVPAGLDWDLWSGQAPMHPYNHQLQKKLKGWQGWPQWRDYSGGDVTLHGAHAADQIQFTLGKDDTDPVEIWPVSTGRDALIRMRYEDGTEIRFERDFGVHWGAVFVGEDGQKIEINRGTVKSNPKELTRDAPPPSGGNANPHLQNWLDCIKTREDPIAPVEAGHRAINLCHFINICRELGRKLRWDPRREEFLGDDEANALIHRSRRKGYELPDLG